ELGPDGVLSAMAQDCVTSDTGAITCVPVLRKDREEPGSLVTSLADLFVRGTAVDWSAYFAGTGACRVDLPTYAFERVRFWPRVLGGVRGGADVGRLGLGAAEHPLLGAVVVLAEGDGLVLTGRLSVRSHPWLADHVVQGVVLLPGTAFVELVLRAGEQVGCPRVDELTLQAPLVIPERGGVQVQVVVSGAGDSGRRAVSVYSRPDGTELDESWTCHAVGEMTADEPQAVSELLVEWPPRDAVSVDVSDLYGVYAGAGFVYGPSFQGLRAAWRRGDEVFA
ncbi:polyketide synthase dehydratase domain-containing protein, partial [Streptomyces marokkonensis]|uniref:polyketide synthase dehydratase domain-containing protein n=1 Tax=Streptomyces marokkonensis TaxID=324855 RepID=UPI0031E7C8D1